MPTKKGPEWYVKAEVKDWLTFSGFFHFPITAGLGSYAGIADIIAVKHGKVLFIECKAGKGRLSDAQERFKEAIEEHGGFYVIAKGYEDVKDFWERHVLKILPGYDEKDHPGYA